MARRAPSVLARALREDNRGSEFVEKLVLVALGALVLLVAVARFSGGIKRVFDNSGRNLENNLSGSPQGPSAIASLPKLQASGDTAQIEVALKATLDKKASLESTPAPVVPQTSAIETTHPPAVPTPLPAPVWTKPGPSPILYVGLGTGPDKEAATLASASAKSGGTIAVISSLQKQQKTMDAAARERALHSLGMPPELERAVSELLSGRLATQSEITLPLVAKLWAAEQGKEPFTRFVFSGHSEGSRIWSANGEILVTDILSIFKLFPKACKGQKGKTGVQHVMLPACNNGWENDVESIRKIFPNLESYWSYTMRSPRVDTGALAHIAIWERATEPGMPPPSRHLVTGPFKASEGLPLRRRLAAAWYYLLSQFSKNPESGVTHADNVAIWTKQHSYEGGPGWSTAEQHLHDASPNNPHWRRIFDEAFDGNMELTASTSSPLYDYTEVLHAMIGDRQTPDAERSDARYRADVILRLRNWTDVTPRFGETYGKAVAAGIDRYNQVIAKTPAERLKQPNWNTLSRKELIDLTDALLDASRVQQHDKDPILKAAIDTLWPLRELDPKVILASWL